MIFLFFFGILDEEDFHIQDRLTGFLDLSLRRQLSINFSRERIKTRLKNSCYRFFRCDGWFLCLPILSDNLLLKIYGILSDEFWELLFDVA